MDPRHLQRARVASQRFLVAAVLLIALAIPAVSRASPVFDAALTGFAAQMKASLDGYMVRSSPTDPRYYSDGVWHATDGTPCWYCYDSAADGAATLGRLDDDFGLEKVAINTFAAAIAAHQLPSGAFTDDTGNATQVGSGFFLVDLGVAYLELYPDLTPATRATWSNAVARGASWLISSGATSWYINGNVNLRQTEVMWLAWAITHQTRFLDEYSTEWSFTIAPPQSRWPGYGLHITKQPTSADGNGGAGYLAESDEGQAPGFDPSYTQAQLDTAADLYVLTRDPRYLRLMNLEFDQLRPRINASWVLDATDGTRKDDMVPFESAALSVLAASGDRPDLVADVAPQLKALEADYRQMAVYTNVNYYKGFESSLSMPLLNAEWPQGMAPASAASVGTIATATVQRVVAGLSRVLRGSAIAPVSRRRAEDGR